jgi:hypothetical protein
VEEGFEAALERKKRETPLRIKIDGEAVPDMNSLNAHTLSSLYETFTPDEAFRLGGKREIHFTPRNGSRTDITGAELSALAAPCPGLRRIGSIQALNTELSARHTQRNGKQSPPLVPENLDFAE